MPIPDFQTVMLPLLRHLEDGAERTGQETLAALAAFFALTPEERSQRLPSGLQTTFSNRIAWAKSHMRAAGLLDSPRRGVYRITERGRKTIAESPNGIGMQYLARFPEYAAFRQGKPAGDAPPTAARSTVAADTDARTPDDLMEEGYGQIRAALASELLSRIGAMPPSVFEQLVVDLLKAMGYGGPHEDSGLVVGGSGDEGIDGAIREDRLGLETIYIQTKRWQGTVSRFGLGSASEIPDANRSVSALAGHPTPGRRGEPVVPCNLVPVHDVGLRYP